MLIDFSIFKNINFKNKDNILFLLVVIFLIIIVFVILAVILLEITRIIKIIIKKISDKIFKDISPEDISEEIVAEKAKKELSSEVDESSEDLLEAIKIPRAKQLGNSGVTPNTDKKAKEPDKNTKQTFELKEQKDISEGLSRLKTGDSSGEQTISSKMPSRTENQETNEHQEIRIPVSKKTQAFEQKEKRGIAGWFSKLKTGNSQKKEKLGLEMSYRTGNLHEEDSNKKIEVTGVKQLGNVGLAVDVKSKEAKEPDKNAKQAFEQKEQKDISQGLSRLKTGDSPEKQTVSSMMPSREPKQEDDSHKAIEIPTARIFEVQGTKGRLEIKTKISAEDKVVIEKQIKEVEREVNEKKKKGEDTKDEEYLIEKLEVALTNEGLEKDEKMKERLKPSGKFLDKNFFRQVIEKIRKNNEEKNEAKKAKERPTIISSRLHGQALTYKEGSAKTPVKNNAQHDDSLFDGASEISRTKLEHELLVDPRAYKAERASGLKLSPVERSKLVNKVFSQTLGRNISKTDVKWGIKKLNQKLSGAKDSAEHEKIREEIKFFKKIGGIK